MSVRRRGVLLSLASVALWGCVGGSEPRVPEVELPASFGERAAGPTTAAVDWRDYFADEHLNALIATALEGNLDLRIAVQRIEIARAIVRQTTGVVLPQVSLGAGAGVRKFGTYTMDGAGNATTDITPGRRVPVNYTDFFVGVQSSWEVDVWGKLRSLRDSARAQFLASIEGTNLVVTTLVAEVASAYFELLALDHSLEILGKTVAQQAQALELMRLQKESGRANELAVKQFEARLASVRAMESMTSRERQQTENRLNLLLGRSPRPIARAKEVLLREPTALASPGVPSDLLQYRPDIREAELLVQASKFDVQAARAAFYPSLTLTAGLGYQAFDPQHLLVTPESLVYSLAAGLSTPLLNRRGLEAQLAVTRALQVQAMVHYQSAILKAFVEVVTGLTAVARASEVVEQKKQEKAALAGAVDAADALFRAGKASYLEVLLAQENLLEAELELIEALKGQRMAGLWLYRSLGGGWRPAASEPRAP